MDSRVIKLEVLSAPIYFNLLCKHNSPAPINQKEAFSYRGALLWNSLSQDLLLANSVITEAKLKSDNFHNELHSKVPSLGFTSV